MLPHDDQPAAVSPCGSFPPRTEPGRLALAPCADEAFARIESDLGLGDLGLNISRRHMGRCSQMGCTIQAVRCTGLWLDREEGGESQLGMAATPQCHTSPLPHLCECCFGLLSCEHQAWRRLWPQILFPGIQTVPVTDCGLGWAKLCCWAEQVALVGGWHLTSTLMSPIRNCWLQALLFEAW